MKNSRFPSSFGCSKLYIVDSFESLEKTALVKKNSAFSLNWNSSDLIDEGVSVFMEYKPSSTL